MMEKCNPSHADKIADRIGGKIVDVVKEYIDDLGGFKNFAEWGLF